MDSLRDIRKMWKKIQQSPVPIAVLRFPHGFECAPYSEGQRLMSEFPHHLVGVYTAMIPFQDFREDCSFMEMDVDCRYETIG